MKTRVSIVLVLVHDPMDFERLTREVREVVEGAFPDRGPVILKRFVVMTSNDVVDDVAAHNKEILDGWPSLPPSRWSFEQRQHVNQCILGRGVCNLCRIDERTQS